MENKTEKVILVGLNITTNVKKQTDIDICIFLCSVE